MVATVASTIAQFNIPNIELLQKMGYTVDVACNFGDESNISPEKVAEFRRFLEDRNVRVWDMPSSRKITAVGSMVKTYRAMKALSKERQYDLVHIHTPIAGAITRLAFRSARKKGTRVIYQAHGFHFFRGAPMQNWLIYYPVEKICARFTDTLITINQEDYQRAKAKFHPRQVVYIPGVGLNAEKYTPSLELRQRKRQELGITPETKVLLSVGELNANKNHETVIKALGALHGDAVYLICGRGGKQTALEAQIRHLGLQERVKILGYRSDVAEIYQAADWFLFPSYREGLSVALMEAMASNLPCIVSKIRGNVDLLDEDCGVLVPPGDVQAWRDALEKALGDSEWGATLARRGQERVKSFSRSAVEEKMRRVYE